MLFGVGLLLLSFMTLCIQSSKALYWPGNPYPPGGYTPQCTECYHLQQSINTLLYYYTELNKKVTCPKGSVTVYGSDATVDTQRSVADCPPYTVLVSCKCSRSDSVCDGVETRYESCRAVRSSVSGDPIQAVATCAYDDPRNYVTVLEPSTDFTTMPVATCPERYKAVDCWLLNPWTQDVLVQTVLDTTAQSCSPSETCTGGRGCKIKALCQKI